MVVAALLRLTGLGRLQPHAPEPDSYLVLQTEILREGREPNLAQSEKGFYAYPLLLAEGLALLPAARAATEASAEVQLEAAAADYLRGRTLVAWLSLLIVPASFLLARRFVDPLAALIAALLVATSLLTLYFGQQARHHAPHASFALLTLLAALQMRARPSWASYLATAALALVTLSLLHSGWFALLPIVAAHALREPSERGQRRAPWFALGLPLAGFGLAWWGFYPRTAEPLDASASYSEGGHTLYWRDIDFSGAVKSARILWDYDPGLTLLALIGAGLALAGARRAWSDAGAAARRDALVVLAYAVPYCAALAAYKETCDRMLLPLIPFLALLAGLAVSRAASLLSVAARPVWLAAALAVPVFGAVSYVRVRDQLDTIEQSAQWLREHAERGSQRIVVAPTITLPLASDTTGLEPAKTDHASRLKRWLRFQLARSAPSDAWPVTPMPGKLFAGADLDKAKARLGKFLDDARPSWIVLDVTKYSRVNPLAAALRDWAERHGELAVTLRGEDDTWRFEPALDYQDVPSLFPRLARATAFGPAIEIYRVRP